MPDTDGLSRDLELAGDLGLDDTGGEQLRGPQPAGLESIAFLLCRRAARDSRHPWILTRPGASRQLSAHRSTRHPSPFNCRSVTLSERSKSDHFTTHSGWPATKPDDW